MSLECGRRVLVRSVTATLPVRDGSLSRRRHESLPTKPGLCQHFTSSKRFSDSPIALHGHSVRSRGFRGKSGVGAWLGTTRIVAFTLTLLLTGFPGASPVLADEQVFGELDAFMEILTGGPLDPDCVLECAERYPELGGDYDKCLTTCASADEVFALVYGFLTIIVTGTSNNGPGWRDEEMDAALTAAEQLEHLRTTPGQELLLIALLREYFEADWSYELRARFLDPYMILVMRDLAIAEDQSSKVLDALYTALAALAKDNKLDAVSPIGRVGVLTIMWHSRVPEEVAGLRRTIGSYEYLEEEARAMVRAYDGAIADVAEEERCRREPERRGTLSVRE